MEKNYIKFQVYLMAIYDKKTLEKSIFYLLPQNSDFSRLNVTFVLKMLKSNQSVHGFWIRTVKHEKTQLFCIF